MSKKLKKHHHFMVTYSQNLVRHLITRPAFIFSFFMSFTTIFCFSWIYYAVEKNQHPHLNTYLDSLYFTISTMTSVGYGDIYPMTPAGKIISMMMMLIGTFIYVSFTGVIASVVLELELKHHPEP
jgi:voltage-gated potassium channel